MKPNMDYSKPSGRTGIKGLKKLKNTALLGQTDLSKYWHYECFQLAVLSVENQPNEANCDQALIEQNWQTR